MATTSVPVDVLAGRLRLVIARAARRLRQEAVPGLTPTMMAALATVEKCGHLTPSELATRERIQRPTATRLIAKLEADGLLARTTDPADHRSSLISLSPRGRELLAETRTRKDAYLARRLRALPAEDRATLARAADVLERLLGEPAD